MAIRGVNVPYYPSYNLQDNPTVTPMTTAPVPASTVSQGRPLNTSTNVSLEKLSISSTGDRFDAELLSHEEISLPENTNTKIRTWRTSHMGGFSGPGPLH